MKKFLLATVSMVVLTSVTRAADIPAAMPAKGPMYSPAPVASWDGFYVGVQGGVVRQDGLLKNVAGDFGSADNKTGGTTGALAGYNWQLGNFVLGLEGDWNWIGAKATHFNRAGTRSTYEVSWLSTLRARTGLTVDSTLFYVTGGVAFAHINDNLASLFTSPTPITSFAHNQTKTGWTVGAGVEHFFAPQWSARAELRYVDLGNMNVACTSGTANCANFSFSSGDFNNTLWMGLVGVNHKFGREPTRDWSQARAYAPPSLPAWGGWYLGIQGGVAGHSASFNDPDGFLTFFPNFFDQRKMGGIIGGLLGYNWQQSSFVYGVEGDWNWIGAKATRLTADINGPESNGDLSTSYAVNWLATLRGRAGLAFDSTLLYVTGGLAFGHAKNDVELIGTGNFAGLQASFTQNQIKVGWTAGVGVEHMLSQHWTARAEFRFVDLGKSEVACTSTGAPAGQDFRSCIGNSYRGTFSNTLKLGLVGLAYKF